MPMYNLAAVLFWATRQFSKMNEKENRPKNWRRLMGYSRNSPIADGLRSRIARFLFGL